jgi:uncharacterized protein YndB with AHSA1/START domain
MSATELVYRIYIERPQQPVWTALYEPEHTSVYWGVRLTSDWKVGSAITWFYAGVTLVDPGSVVVAFDPPRRLSYTWHTTTPEFARVVGMAEEMQRRLAAERRSTIRFDLEPHESMTKVVLTQSGFEPGSAKLASLTESWPRIMSRLKTYLELRADATP